MKNFEENNLGSAEKITGDKEKDKDLQQEKYKVAVVDIGGAVEDQARDVAEERMTADKKDLKGIKGFVSKIWKHNLFREYYRQKEIFKAKKEILLSGNIYAGETENLEFHNQAMESIIGRFTGEYEETIHKEAGEEKKGIDKESYEDRGLNRQINGLIREYASGQISKKSLCEEKNRIFAEYNKFRDKKDKKEPYQVDNILEIAEAIKKNIKHNSGIGVIEEEIEVILGKAKLGVRTESKYNMVDRIVAKLQSTKIGRLLNETTIASGVAIAYSLTAGLSQQIARSRMVAFGTFGASALVSAGVAGMRESVKVEDERRQHSRERAKGKEITPGSKRREEMEKAKHQTISAKEAIASFKKFADAKDSAEKDYMEAINSLSEIEARIKISDCEKLDLIAYSDFKFLEKERWELDIARAQAKVKLEKNFKAPSEISFGEYYSSVLNTLDKKLHKDIQEKDKEFKKIKTKRIAGAALKSAVMGFLIGGAIQEAVSFATDTEGLAENIIGNGDLRPESVTALEGVRRWIENDEIIRERVISNVIINDNAHVSLPEGVEILPNLENEGMFLFIKDGEVIADNITFDDGKLSEASEALLENNNVIVGETLMHTVNLEEAAATPKEFIENNPEMFQEIRREMWYDNNTLRFDLNELKTHYGGIGGTGIDADGNYVISVAKMTEDGSFHGDVSINAREAFREGRMSMLLSLSRDSQEYIVEIPINSEGKAIVDPESDIARMFFEVNDNRLEFTGKFMEIAETRRMGEDGVKEVNLLSTVVGPGKEVMEMTKEITTQIPVTEFRVIDKAPFIEPPLFIPIFGRTPLERVRNLDNLGNSDNQYEGRYRELDPLLAYRGYYSEKIIRKDYEHRMSEEAKNNPDCNFDPNKEINRYLEKQEKEHYENIKQLADQAGSIGDDCLLSVCIPVAGHQEENHIYKTLENYLYQTELNSDKKIDSRLFEIVLFVNRPDKDKKGDIVVPDNTEEEIEKFRKEHPEITIRVINQIIPAEKARIGYIRKILNDIILLRQLDKNNRLSRNDNHIILSNDADNRGIDKEYIANFIDKFEKHPEVDAYLGQIDWDVDAYVKNPLIHVGTRLFQYIDAQLRRKNKLNTQSSGANFAFRTEAYAAGGGYRSGDELAEDVDLGNIIKAMRIGSKNKTGIDFAGAHSSRLFTSARRVEETIKQGLAPVEMWNTGFTAFDSYRTQSDLNKEASAVDYNNPESVKNFVKNLENIINRTIEAVSWMNEDKEIFKRALGWLGLSYRFNKDTNNVTITNADKLINGLKEYSKSAENIKERLRPKTV